MCVEDIFRNIFNKICVRYDSDSKVVSDSYKINDKNCEIDDKICEIDEADDGGPAWVATCDMDLKDINDIKMKNARARQRAMLLGINQVDQIDAELIHELDKIKNMCDSTKR